MTTKQFYLLCLIGVTSIGGMILFLIWRQIKLKLPENKGLVFISLAMFSWTMVGLYKFFDPPMPSLINAINDRILSAFSNLFLIASLPYFPNLFLKLKERFAFFRKPEQWVINVFIFFAVITAIFTIIDRNIENDFGKKLIIAIDSILSVITMTLISYALYQSITRFWKDKASKICMIFIFIILISTQIVLPLIAIFPDQFKFLYYGFLILLLLGFVFFNFIAIAYFSMLNLEMDEIIYASKEKEKKDHFQINKLNIGYNITNKHYFIDIDFINTSNKEIVNERIENQKLLLPFSNWVLFSISKILDVKIANADISTTKFRMVEYWNKDAEIKITQEQLFQNDRGLFDLNVDASLIQIENIISLEKKYIIKEAIQKHIDCFYTQFDQIDKSKINSQDIIALLSQKNR